jgi:hypothetical protein
MTLRSMRSLLVATVALGLAVGCSDPASRSIAIVTPTDGASLTEADDVTDTLAGVQIDVTVQLTGFATGDTVSLVVNDNVADGIDRSYDGGIMVFTPVTLDPGENVIVVSGGGARATATVTLEGDVCPRLQFVRPTASARLETRDDADGDPANGFQYDVQLTTTAADGTPVELIVGGATVATVDATAGRADFSAVELLAAYPEPGAAANVTLRAQTTAACSATITVQVVAADEPCSTFTFVQPADGAVFGVADDENGDPADGFQQTIVASTDAAAGTEVALLIDGSTVGSTTVAGTVVRFESVDIPEGTHVLRVQTSVDCGAEISVTVDTGAPTCDITAPTGGFLNAADDVDPATAGLQVDFDVASDGGDGQPVRLIIDGDDMGARSQNLSGGRAVFAAVGLSEGDHTARARCQNSVGNVGFSATFTYTVDSVTPTCTITAPANGTWFNTGDDALTAVDGTQVQLTVSAAGAPTATTVSRCGYAPLDPEGLVTLDGSGSGSGYVTLAGPGNEVCCGVQDEAGNAGESRITLNLESDAPQFEIRRPDATVTLILAVDDEGPSDTLCQYTVTVGCSSIGQPVTLYVNTIAKTPATCTASVDALGGTATWGSAELPQGTVVLYADGSGVGGLTGRSPDKSVTIDTEPPVLVMAVPACGRIFTPADDNRDGLADGIQIRVEIQASDPGAVTLAVTDAGGAAITGSPYTVTPSGGYAVFPNVTVVPAGLTYGTGSFSATATDVHGQVGTSLPSPCTVEVRDVPQVVITSPSTSALLGPANDCNPSTPAFDLGVTVSTNIAAGAGTVELFVAGASAGTQAYAGSPVTFCVPAADGTGIAVRADGTDVRGTGTASITVSIDSRPPDVPVSDLAILIADRRGGLLDLNWTAPSDAGGGAVTGYQIRCLTSTSGTATFDWATATTYSFTGTAAAPGGAQTQRLTGFHIERFVMCMVRAVDGVGSLGPLGNSPQVHLQFLQAEVLGPASGTGFGGKVAPLGDVSGDGRPDFAVGVPGTSSVYLFLGGGSAVPSTWTTVVSGPAGSGFGTSIAGLGDFDGDGQGEFLVGAPNADVNKGRAYIFRGRASWPATLDVSSADVTIICDDSSSTQDDGANLGWAVASAGDFDGDTRPDAVISLRGWNAFQGAALLLFGRSGLPVTLTVPGDRSAGFAGDFWLSAGSVGTQFSSAISGGLRIGDDSLDDVVLSAPYGTSGGAVYVLSGRPRTTTSGLTTVATYDQQLNSPVAARNVNFGVRLSLAMLDADSHADLLVAIDRPIGALAFQGGVLAYLSGTGALPATSSGLIQNNSADPTGDRLGFYLPSAHVPGISNLADLDGSSRFTPIIGMSQWGTGGGGGFVFLDRDYTTTTNASTFDVGLLPDAGDVTSEGTVDYAGDVNGDGAPDALVGHTAHSAGRGRVIILY